MSWINERSRNKALHKEAISPFLRGALTNQYHPLSRTTEAILEQPWPIKVSGPSERFRISNFKMHLIGSFFSFQRTTVPSGLTWDRNVIVYSNLTQMFWTHKSLSFLNHGCDLHPNSLVGDPWLCNLYDSLVQKPQPLWIMARLRLVWAHVGMASSYILFVSLWRCWPDSNSNLNMQIANIRVKLFCLLIKTEKVKNF